MQGMCDLAAPLLVMMREEASAHALFARVMDRARDNFPSGQAMDAHFADMRSVIHNMGICTPVICWGNPIKGRRLKDKLF